MQENKLIDWIRLINTDNIGPVSFYKLLEKFGSAADALANLEKQKKTFPRRDAEYEIDKATRLNIRILMRGDTDYPQNLKHMSDAPPVLYVRGQVRLLNYPASIAVVGSRNASINGRKIASKLAYDLTENDVLIISGLARGIDAAAHKGALYAKRQCGATIAVLGTGADIPYPTENTDLYEKICTQGAIVSEFLLGTKAQPQNFPRRNRIVSALSHGILVGEASVNSGSLITARLGLEQGKDIFAIPGSPMEGRSSGANKLIREGAYLTESAEDILEVLRTTQQQQIKDYINPDLFATPLDKPKKNVDIRIQNHADTMPPICDLIPTGGIEADELIRKSGLSAADAMMQITELELDGFVERFGSRLIKR